MGQRRKFDHEEARRLRRNGLTYPQIARRLGVSSSAVRQVVNNYYRSEEAKRRRAEWARQNLRAPCVGGCGRLVWTVNDGRSGLCPRCSADARTTTVRPTTLLCGRCREWKPDDDFSRDKSSPARRGRCSECRSCQTAGRRERRARAKVPCVNCGRPRTPGTQTGLCRVCNAAGAAPLLLGEPGT